MIQKKICLLGSFSVGKTSLISRYVNSLFSEKYLTTVGVKIDKKQLTHDGNELSLIIWDIAGEDDFTNIRTAYLRGMAGYIIVIDGTRQNSYDVALSIHEMVKQHVGELPMVFALNKADLKPHWQVDGQHIRPLEQFGYPVLETSAKLDNGVADIFLALIKQWGSNHD
ncbi:MAG: GTP-binding protein [Thiothrix sp.]|uniref:Rab family GTPase n=1 Tax=Thiothrix sp. TaxID=1032 RepID=UPI002618BC37|nr:Rab family GTPase [Thiothrix sp.]MDD5393317.1 GTP-binding protein [Thiothrix sp.]